MSWGVPARSVSVSPGPQPVLPLLALHLLPELAADEAVVSGEGGRFGGGRIMFKASENLTALSFQFPMNCLFGTAHNFLPLHCKSVPCDRRRRMSRPLRPSPARSTQGRPRRSWACRPRPPRHRQSRRRHPGVQFNRYLREDLNGALNLQNNFLFLKASQNTALFSALNHALNF